MLWRQGGAADLRAPFEGKTVSISLNASVVRQPLWSLLLLQTSIVRRDT